MSVAFGANATCRRPVPSSFFPGFIPVRGGKSVVVTCHLSVGYRLSLMSASRNCQRNPPAIPQQVRSHDASDTSHGTSHGAFNFVCSTPVPKTLGPVRPGPAGRTSRKPARGRPRTGREARALAAQHVGRGAKSDIRADEGVLGGASEAVSSGRRRQRWEGGDRGERCIDEVPMPSYLEVALARSTGACCRAERVVLLAPTARGGLDPTVWTVGAAPHEKKLVAIVVSAVEIAPPERIIFFGPAAQGKMVENGDLDLLVVADTRPDDAWHAGSARRGRGGAGPLTSLSRPQRWRRHARPAGAGATVEREPETGRGVAAAARRAARLIVAADPLRVLDHRRDQPRQHRRGLWSTRGRPGRGAGDCRAPAISVRDDFQLGLLTSHAAGRGRGFDGAR